MTAPEGMTGRGGDGTTGRGVDGVTARGVDVAVVVVSWNTCDLLRACLASLAAQGPGPSVEVWVVDNGSSDGSVDMVRREFPAVRLVANPTNVGFAAANNQAIVASDSTYVLLLNSDAVVPPRAVADLVDFLSRRPAAGACGPMLCNPDGSFQASYADFPRLDRELAALCGLHRVLYGPAFPSHEPRDSTRPRVVDWVGGACLLMRRAVLTDVGLLDPGFPLYSEEVDWCYRACRAGWEVWYCPDVAVIHLGGGSSREQQMRRRSQIRAGKIRFFHKHRGRRQAATLAAAMHVADGARVVLAVAGRLALRPRVEGDAVRDGRARTR